MPRGHVTPNGAKVAALRGQAGLAQWELARLAGYGLRTIGKIEGGRPTNAATLEAVAEVLGQSLSRPIGLDELLAAEGPAAAHAGNGLRDLVVQDTVKVLDLRACAPGNRAGSRAVLLDHQRFRPLPEGLSELTFLYATTGTGLEGQCLSHPQGARWDEVGDPGTAAALAPHLGRRFALRVRPAGGCGCDILNRVEYVGSFCGAGQEWFHTHVMFPTECLTALVWFPPERPFLTLRGLVQTHPAGPFEPAAEQPAGIPAGLLAYWRLPAPQPGVTYQIEWSW
jgi:transcriptional regulator with XRE-family HTH domain